MLRKIKTLHPDELMITLMKFKIQLYSSFSLGSEMTPSSTLTLIKIKTRETHYADYKCQCKFNYSSSFSAGLKMTNISSTLMSSSEDEIVKQKTRKTLHVRWLDDKMQDFLQVEFKFNYSPFSIGLETTSTFHQPWEKFFFTCQVGEFFGFLLIKWVKLGFFV